VDCITPRGRESRPLPLKRGLGFALVLAMFLTGALHNAKAAGGPDSDQLKAAYLFNFAKFVAWPEDRFDSDGSALVFCMVGDDPLNGALDKVTSGRSVQGRQIEIQNFATPASASTCHILFLGSGAVGGQPGDVLKNYNGGGVLTVGESEGFAKDGGVANFFVDGKKVRFEINKQAAQDQGLKISSRLLKLARIVSTEGN
jgi:hypothetical protein